MNLPLRMRTTTVTAALAAALALAACGDRQGAPGKAPGNGPNSSASPPASSTSPSGSGGMSGAAPASPSTPPPSSSSEPSGTPPAGSPSNSASTNDMKKSAASPGEMSGGSSSASPGATGSSTATTPSGATGRASSASTTGSAMPGTPGGAAVGKTERDFMMKMAAGGKAEVEAAKIAAEKATNPQVKQFAQKMVQDHGATNDELMKLAQAKGVTLPPAQADKGDHAGALKRIANAKGADVDKQFLRGFGADEHKKDIQAFERAARESNDPDVRAFAEKTLPTLREHLQMAQQLQGQVNGKAAGAKSGSTQTSMN